MKWNSICYEIGGMGLGDGYKENGVWDRLEETLGVRKWQYVYTKSKRNYWCKNELYYHGKWLSFIVSIILKGQRRGGGGWLKIAESLFLNFLKSETCL